MTNDFPTAMSRRTLLLGVAMSGTLHALGKDNAERLKISVFSKHLQWTSIAEAAAIAGDVGFDGLDLTVRAQGHVLPERVETDLPAAVEAAHRAGLSITMISTEITGAQTPYAAAMLKTASQLGIRHYRWGGLTYPAGQGIAARLDALKPQAKALAELSEKYQICGIYHTHSGPGLVGAPIWDLWTLFQGLDPRWIAVNYDIGHATVEGGYGGWIASARLLKEQMKGIALKDFSWQQNKEGAWVPHWCAMGKGMVNFPGFFAIAKANGFFGPVQLHFEYPGLGGAENGDKTLTIPRQDLIAAMRRDLTYTRRILG